MVIQCIFAVLRTLFIVTEFSSVSSNRSHPRSASASSHRPFSAKHSMTPSPPSSERSGSARIRPASARPRPASAKPRPASARLTYSSHKDYIVSTACRDIPQSPSPFQTSRGFRVGETRTSQMRLSLSRKTTDSWMLQETREYVAKKHEDFKQHQPKRNELCICRFNIYFSYTKKLALSLIKLRSNYLK